MNHENCKCRKCKGSLHYEMPSHIGFQIIGANYFQAVGKAGYAIVLSLSRQVIILIPLILVLPGMFGLNGAWMASPIADFIAAVLTGVFLMKEIRKLGVM